MFAIVDRNVNPTLQIYVSYPALSTVSALVSLSVVFQITRLFTQPLFKFNGLVQKMLVFNESYLNLREIILVHCTLQLLYISSNVWIETLHVSHSSIDMVYIEDETDNLRIVSVVNSTFENIRLSRKTKHTFEFHVHKSTMKNPIDIMIAYMVGVHVDLSESRGFPSIIHSFYDNPLVNFSSCNLTRQPNAANSVIETVTLDLSYNLLTKWHMSPVVQILYLQGNLLETIDFKLNFKKSEARLQYLDLSENFIEKIEKDDFVDLPNILYLKIRNNRLLDIHENAFSVISKLINVDLSKNRLRSLKRSHFIYLSNLKYLYLQNNNIKVVEGMFDGLINIQFLQVDSFTLCCAQPKAVGKIHCSAPVNEISSCYNLIDTPLLSIIIWYIALFSVFGNLLGLLYRLLVLRERKTISFFIYSMNLGIADFFMGVYLYIIAIANLMFTGRYGFEDDSWRQSPLCTFAGVLATLSSEASALFVLSITIDRIAIIRFPFGKFEKSRLVAKLISVLVWTISLLLSLLPLFGNQYFDDYYFSSGICISLPLSVLRKPGWEYSMVIFVAANFIIFIAILLGQFVIFTDVIRMGKEVSSKRTSQKKREINLAKTLIMVAVTDMFCWIPIGVIGLLTFFGKDVTAKVYAWVIVVVLPINSALNPIIYTFSAILRRKRQKV
ncbi:G-protein coupled receptor GRL101-like [Saccostrea cucullata]|uniref:G-protein coupled receptor GRL101-like n=1 Tax=Saccostrea cuccullata TaxID=36930 RepID=UPI002ECFB8EC